MTEKTRQDAAKYVSCSYGKNHGVRTPFLFGKYLAAYLKESVSFFGTAAEEETEDLDALAREARRQIDTREYTTEMLADFAAHGEKHDILKFGMAFYKKALVKALVVCKGLPQ